jgi:DnaJ-class molecular chaperone
MAKRPFTMHYRTYDDTTGRGNPRQWRSTFRSAMGLDEARARLGDRSPWEVLGVSLNATADQVRSAYRRLALKWHPDRAVLNGLTEAEAHVRMQELTAAYTVLEDRRR